MRTLYVILFACFLFAADMLRAQDMHDGLISYNNTARSEDPSAQDGNGALGGIFDTTLCGLNYTQCTRKLGQRITPPGLTQPASFPIAGMPSCSPIVKAYIWCVTLGTGVPVTVNITNPDGVSASFTMSVVGQGGDLCWGATGTFVYRADVTSVISSNGNYIVSGLPTSPTMSSSANDADGATLLIMYQDLSSPLTGSIHLMDGCVGILGGSTTQTITGMNACAASSGGSAFVGVADLQMAGATYNLNGSGTATYNSFNWMDFISQPTAVTNGQTSSNFTFTSGGDCYCLFMGGLFWQTSCLTCNTSGGGLTVQSSGVTPATCGPNGSASVNVSGGSGNYQISWSTVPTQYGSSATNLTGGSYMVMAVDTATGMCGNLLVVVPSSGPSMTLSSTPANCQNGGTATATVSGGTQPYTYSWSPTGGNAATATNLGTGTFTCTMTDGSGCTISGTVSVTTTGNTMNVNVLVIPDSCPSPSGSASAYVTSGVPPYTYLWSPGNQTTPVITNVAAGTYTVSVTDNTGCVINSVVNIPYNNGSIGLTAAPVPAQSCGAWVQLQATTSVTPATYNWQPSTYLSATNVSNPYCNPFGPITYTVIATTSCGSDTVLVPVAIDSSITGENICMVTVDTAMHRCVVVWQQTFTPSFGSFTIYRETATPGVYSPIATQHASAPTSYMDWGSTPWFGTSRYKIAYTDSCGSTSTQSPQHRTMFLQVAPASPSGFNLTWSGYEGAGVTVYNIYRGPSLNAMSNIGQVSGATFNYTDPTPASGTVIYIVEAGLQTGGCNTSVATFPSAWSNIWSSAWVGVEENPLQNSLAVTPNPGNGNFVVQCDAAAGEDVMITITDALGRIVYTSVDENQNGTFRKELDLSALSGGVYNVQVNSGNATGVTRLVITE